MADFLQQLQRDAAACDAVLQQLIAETKGPANRLLEAMQYAVFNGGKRMRAALVLGASRMALGAGDAAAATEGTLRTAAAIECLHAYSLVHDDLPAMDDDGMRRGQLSNHVKFNEATAILAGDALQALAFETIASSKSITDAPKVEAVRMLAAACGHPGMVFGHQYALDAERNELLDIELSHSLKTAKLIQVALTMP